LKGEIENLQSSAEVALRALKEPLWSMLPNLKWSIGNAKTDEQQFLDKFTAYLESKG
jgi:hypothetical protein